MENEFRRNGERYRFMKWATASLKGMCVHPPGTGIMHTINLERLAKVVSTENRDRVAWAFPDTWRNRSGTAGAAAALSPRKGVGLRAAARSSAKVW
jgi:hypothetical protein